MPFGHDGHDHVPIPGPSLVSESTSLCGTSSVHTIEDEIGPRNGKVNRPCNHTVIQTTIVPFSYESNPIYMGYWADGILEYREVHKNKTYSGGTPPAGLWGSIGSLDIQQFHSKTISDSLEQIPTQLSLPNFLLEIDDFGRTLDVLKQLQGFGYRSVKDLKLGLSTSGGRKNLVERFTEYGANVHLAYQFGVKPMISDIQSSFDVIAKVQRRIAHLKRTRGKRIKIRRSKGFNLPLYPESRWFFSGPYYTKWTPTEGKTTLSMGLDIVQNLQGLDDVSRLVTAYGSALGFNKPLSVLWEAIPFSFLVDYVTNIGAAFQQPAFEAFEGKITALDGWSSVKTEVAATLEIGVPPSYGGFPPVWSGAVYEYKRKTYSRAAGIPTINGLVFDTKLSGVQAANIAALIRQSM